MKPEEINVAIALQCGYRRSTYAKEGRPGIGDFPVWALPSGGFVDDYSESGDYKAIPNYHGDLNACQSAVLSQSEKFQDDFDSELKNSGKWIASMTSKEWCDIFIKLL